MPANLYFIHPYRIKVMMSGRYVNTAAIYQLFAAMWAVDRTYPEHLQQLYAGGIYVS